MRADAIGMFWEDTSPDVRRNLGRVPENWGPIPSIPSSSWRPPVEFPNLSAAKVIGFDTETFDPELTEAGPGWGRGVGHIIGVSVAVDDGSSWYFPIRHGVTPNGGQLLPPEHAAMNMDPVQVMRYLDHVLHDQRPKVGANLLYDVGWLNWEGVRVGGRLYDVQYAEALLNSETPDVSLEGLGRRYLDEGKESTDMYAWLSRWNQFPATGNQRRYLYVTPPSLAGPYAEADAALPIKIMEKQWPLMDKRGVLDLFDLECRLTPLLVAMRLKGAPVNTEKAEKVKRDLTGLVGVVEQKLRDLVGYEVNPASGQSMEKAFTTLGIPIPRKVSKVTGQDSVSFDKKLLKSIDHPFVHLVTDHRELLKVRDTFIQSYVLEKHVNGRLYTSFHPLKSDQGGTRSGRLSCVDSDTPIVTRRGKIPIKDVVVGDFVWTHKRRWRAVVATYIHPADKMYTATMSTGEHIICTGLHRFLTKQGWKTLNELNRTLPQKILYDECLDTERQGNLQIHCRALPRRTLPVDSADTSGGERQNWKKNKRWHNSKRALSLHSKKPLRNAEGNEVQRIKNRGEKSNVPDKTGKSPFVHRGPCWGRWACLEAALRHNVLKQSFSSLRRSWDTANKSTQNERLRCASHRRQSVKRQHQQLSTLYASWTRCYSRKTDRKQETEIQSVADAGVREVFDITVDEDASYLACGLFNHNSSDPNLQNIPVRSDYGKLVRQVFDGTLEGIRWRSFDYSSIEYRLLAHFAVGTGSDEVREIYAKDATADYHKIVGELIRKLTGLALDRGKVKTINFGIIYGMQLNSLSVSLGLKKKDASKLLDDYHAAAPYAKATMDSCANEVHRTGIVRTILNRASDFNSWGSKKYSDEGRISLPYAAAASKWGSHNIERSSTHKALNRKLQGSAADVMKKAMVDAWEAGLFAEDACGVPILTVHDELDFEDKGDIDNPAWSELKRIMENCIALKVPLLVESDTGATWGDAH